MDVENQVQEFLISHSIPHKKNVKIRRNKMTVAEFDLIIPGAIIEVKSGIFNSKYMDTGSIEKLCQQIIRQRKYMPPHFKLYIYVIQQLDDKTIEIIQEIDNDVIIIYDLNEIRYDKYEYATKDTGVIRAIASNENNNIDLMIQQFGEINIPSSIYKRSIVGMSDTDLSNLNRFKFHFTDELPERYIYITGRDLGTYAESSLWNVFYLKVPYYLLKHTSNLMYIDNITDWCKRCNQIKFIECIQNNICSWCSNGEVTKKRKRELDPNLIPHLSGISSPKRMKLVELKID